MGCWGITAFESDSGLDGIGIIANYLDGSGKLDLKKLIGLLPINREIYAPSHTKHMALAELMLKYVDHDTKNLDFDGTLWKHHFSDVTSFVADKPSIQWMRDYLTEMLREVRENAAHEKTHGIPYGGWRTEKSWVSWQKHMETLIGRMDALLAFPGESLDLVSVQQQTMKEQRTAPIMGM